MAEYIGKKFTKDHLQLESDCGYIKTLEDVFKVIDAIPTAEVAPVVHGRWEKSGSLLECQYCGEIYSQLGGNSGKSWKYCPNCGAKMDGDNNGNYE